MKDDVKKALASIIALASNIQAELESDSCNFEGVANDLAAIGNDAADAAAELWEKLGGEAEEEGLTFCEHMVPWGDGCPICEGF